MSMMGPHIRTLRAEADALKHQADILNVGKQTDASLSVIGWLFAQATAKRLAADSLEDHERDLESRLVSIPPRSSDK